MQKFSDLPAEERMRFLKLADNLGMKSAGYFGGYWTVAVHRDPEIRALCEAILKREGLREVDRCYFSILSDDVPEHLRHGKHRAEYLFIRYEIEEQQPETPQERLIREAKQIRDALKIQLYLTDFSDPEAERDYLRQQQAIINALRASKRNLNPASVA